MWWLFDLHTKKVVTCDRMTSLPMPTMVVDVLNDLCKQDEPAKNPRKSVRFAEENPPAVEVQDAMQNIIALPNERGEPREQLLPVNGERGYVDNTEDDIAGMEDYIS